MNRARNLGEREEEAPSPCSLRFFYLCQMMGYGGDRSLTGYFLQRRVLTASGFININIKSKERGAKATWLFVSRSILIEDISRDWGSGKSKAKRKKKEKSHTGDRRILCQARSWLEWLEWRAQERGIIMHNIPPIQPPVR